MTPLDMQIAFKRRADRLGLPVAQYEDVFYFLNLAQDELVRRLYRSGFEASQDVIDDLDEILLQNDEQEASYLSDFSYQGGFKADSVPLPTERLFIVNYRAKMWYLRGGITAVVSGGKRYPEGYFDSPSPSGSPSPTDADNARVVTTGLKTVQSDDLYRLLEDPYNKTYYKEPLAQQANQLLVVYTDSTFIIDKVYISYLKRPRKIIRGKATAQDQASELPEILHREVVQIAVQMYLNSKQQTDPNER